MLTLKLWDHMKSANPIFEVELLGWIGLDYFSKDRIDEQGVYNSGNSRSSGKKKDSGNSRPAQGTFMNKVNNLFIWRNKCIELKK